MARLNLSNNEIFVFPIIILLPFTVANIYHIYFTTTSNFIMQETLHIF